ncbi:hypothetical protein Droror1_Dr00012789 [Drosera rotundifolia]
MHFGKWRLTGGNSATISSSRGRDSCSATFIGGKRGPTNSKINHRQQLLHLTLPSLSLTSPAAAIASETGEMGRSATLPRKLTITKSIGSMAAKMGGDAVVNWFPGHMAAAIRAIRDRLKVADLVLEVRDSRIPLSSVNEELQGAMTGKRRVIALNKKDLANPYILQKWNPYFEACGEDCVSINAHSKSSVRKILDLVELKLKEVIAREPTLLVMVVGVPNVGKSALINSIHQISLSRFPAQDKTKRATVGPLPGVTQDIAGYKKCCVFLGHAHFCDSSFQVSS